MTDDELVEKVVDAMWDAYEVGEWDDMARAALAVFREHTAQEIKGAKRDAWAEADLAHYPLVLAVEEFIHNGEDGWGLLDGPFDRVKDLRNPYADENAAPVPELFPGVAAALDDLTIWKDKADD